MFSVRCVQNAYKRSKFRWKFRYLKKKRGRSLWTFSQSMLFLPPHFSPGLSHFHLIFYYFSSYLSLSLMQVLIHVDAGSNTSTVTLRVIGGDEKGILKSETVKDGNKSQVIRTRERLRWRGPAAYTKDRLVLSSERAPHKNKIITIKE
jgi:hypothetical protein